MKSKGLNWRKKGEELLKVGQFVLMMFGMEMLLTWALCHIFHREKVGTALFDQAVLYTAVIGSIPLVGLTDVLLPKVKQSVKLIGISVVVYLAGMVYFSFMPIRLLRDWRLILWFSGTYAMLMLALIYMWRLYELSIEKRYAACIMKFQQTTETSQK